MSCAYAFGELGECDEYPNDCEGCPWYYVAEGEDQ